jgi:hypothetical protein
MRVALVAAVRAAVRGVRERRVFVARRARRRLRFRVFVGPMALETIAALLVGGDGWELTLSDAVTPDAVQRSRVVRRRERVTNGTIGADVGTEPLVRSLRVVANHRLLFVARAASSR